MYNEKTIEKLKQKILDLAIRGKLVPQDPSDEPASILIEKIRKEKEKLIKEGKIKKPKEDSFIFKGSDNLYYENLNGKVKCIQDEIPFEIPKSWEWCRLYHLGNILGGGTPSTSIKEYWENGTINWFTPAFMSNINNKYVWETNIKISLKGLKHSSAKLFSDNSIIMSSRAPIGYLCINKIVACTSQGCKTIELYNKSILEYMFLAIKSNINFIISIASGTTFKEISLKKFSNLLVPIPPLNEQIKIANKYNKLINIIENIQKENDNTNKIKKSLKNKLLDLIFNPNSSYKSYYGNRISTNLEEYIDKNDIGDGDWVLSKNMDEKGNIKLIQLKHIGSGKYIDKPYCKINNSFFTQNKCSKIKKDYLLINRLISDKMNVCIMPDIQSKCITSVDVCWIKPNNKYLTKYLMYYLMSPCIQKEVLNLCSGSTRKRISKKNLIKIPMLIHNLNVQKEIVKEIDKIFSLIDCM